MEKELKKQYYKGFFACVKILILLTIGFYCGVKYSESVIFQTANLQGGLNNRFDVTNVDAIEVEPIDDLSAGVNKSDIDKLSALFKKFSK